MFDKFFSFWGGKTKFFATVTAVATALEATGVVPAGSLQVVVQVVQAVAAAGVVFGFRDAIAKVTP